jgi:hypothetical protein
MFGLFKKEAFSAVPNGFSPILNAAFPGGEKQLEQEADGLLENFPHLFTLDSSRRLLTWAKSMWVNNTGALSFDDMCEAISQHEYNRLSKDQCTAIYSKILEQDFATRKNTVNY